MKNHRTARPSETIRLVLERTLKEQGLARRLERRLPRHVWREAVGPGIAERAQPTVLVAGVLHLLVEDNRWRDQLDAARTFIIERVNACLGRPLVRELRFGLAHAGALPPRQGVAPQEHPEPDLEAEVPAAARLHPDLRAAFQGAATAAQRSLARARGR
jgi:predicted nucleic acid-binding Zn ribbon protein